MSELEDAIARFRSRLAVRESEAVGRIVADYHEVEQALREELLFILREVDSVPPEARLGRLMRRDRLISLERQLVRELERITGRTYRDILKEQQHAARTASEDFLKLLDIATGGVADGIGFSFVRLNTEAVEHLIAALQDASPLQELMAELPQHAARRLRRELIHGVAVGRNPRETARAAAGALGGNMARALTISRTETLRAYRAATLEGYRRNSGVVRGWTWMSSLDRRTCPVCVAMHGTFHPLDEGFATHPSCFPAGTVVSGPPVRGSTERRYSGPVVEIETALGNRLTATPNHPVLTPLGWVRAGFLSEGDEVISQRLPERPPEFVDPDEHQVPALIEHVARASSRSLPVTTMGMEGAAEDFHGDGLEGEVSVVRTYGLLSDRVDAPFAQPGGEFALRRGPVALARFDTLCPAHTLFEGGFAATRRSMGGTSVGGMLVRGPAAHHEAIGFGHVADSRASLEKVTSNHISIDAKPNGERLLGLTEFVESCNLSRIELMAVSPPPFPETIRPEIVKLFRGPSKAAIIQRQRQAPITDPIPSGSDLVTHAGQVVRDRVLKVLRRGFSGHVYNLQTDGGWFVAAGVIVHNCRCSAAPATRTWAELGMPGVPETAPTIESGADWFRRQPAATRARILGPAKFRAVQSRRLALEDLVGISESPRWGPGRFERSLASIVGSPEAASLSSTSRAASAGGRRPGPRPKPTAGSPPPPRRPRARPAPPGDDGDPLRDIHPSAAAMRRITNARQIRSARWYMEQRAAARGMGLDEMESALEAHLRRLLRNARVNRRQHAWDLVTILDDGRFKTQFETGTSGGALNPTIRASREQSLFNLSRSTSPSLRPIYGYLTDGLADDNSYGPAFYGAVRVLFRQDVARRTTFVFTDSLSAIPAQAPSPLGQPRWYSHDLWGDPLELKSVNEVSPYAEAQIHGGVTIDAIEKVFLNSRTAENHPGLMAKLADHRIPWEFDDTLGVE